MHGDLQNGYIKRHLSDRRNIRGALLNTGNGTVHLLCFYPSYRKADRIVMIPLLNTRLADIPIRRLKGNRALN